MTPYYADDWLTVYGGDCRTVMATLPTDSVDCVVTSPPYWGLRDYGHDGQLGLERTPEEYVANLVAVFAEVRRVLKPSGTCWLNLGDTFAANPSYQVTDTKWTDVGNTKGSSVPSGLKPKDLVGIPWRVAFALQADGWYLRSDIIWSKPNPMPESVTDRPTKSHEYLFLLTKSARYYFDADAVREASVDPPGVSLGGALSRFGRDEKLIAANAHRGNRIPVSNGQRNIRSVWTIATRPYPGAHFAVFPPELPERCIKAGSSERGVCPECGAPWERVTVKEKVWTRKPREDRRHPSTDAHGSDGRASGRASVDVRTFGSRPTCDCLEIGEERGSIPMPPQPVPAVILDPFAGSGTVGMVANRLSRRAILIDLNPEYLKQQMRRNAQTPLGLAEVSA